MPNLFWIHVTSINLVEELLSNDVALYEVYAICQKERPKYKDDAHVYADCNIRSYLKVDSKKYLGN